MSIVDNTIECGTYEEEVSSEDSFAVAAAKIPRYHYAQAIADLFEFGAKMYSQSHLQNGAPGQKSTSTVSSPNHFPIEHGCIVAFYTNCTSSFP